jgi:hypothetical protein
VSSIFGCHSFLGVKHFWESKLFQVKKILGVKNNYYSTTFKEEKTMLVAFLKLRISYEFSKSGHVTAEKVGFFFRRRSLW